MLMTIVGMIVNGENQVARVRQCVRANTTRSATTEGENQAADSRCGPLNTTSAGAHDESKSWERPAAESSQQAPMRIANTTTDGESHAECVLAPTKTTSTGTARERERESEQKQAAENRERAPTRAGKYDDHGRERSRQHTARIRRSNSSKVNPKKIWERNLRQRSWKYSGNKVIYLLFLQSFVIAAVSLRI